MLSEACYTLFRPELKVNVIVASQTWRTPDIALCGRHLWLDSCVKLLPTEMGSWHCLPAWGCLLCVCFNWKLIVRGLLWKWYHCLQTANPAFCKETLVVLFVLVDLRSSKAWRRKGDANILLKKMNLHIYNIIFECQRYQVYLTFAGKNEYKLLNFMLISTTLLSRVIRHFAEEHYVIILVNVNRFVWKCYLTDVIMETILYFLWST